MLAPILESAGTILIFVLLLERYRDRHHQLYGVVEMIKLLGNAIDDGDNIAHQHWER